MAATLGANSDLRYWNMLPRETFGCDETQLLRTNVGNATLVRRAAYQDLDATSSMPRYQGHSATRRIRRLSCPGRWRRPLRLTDACCLVSSYDYCIRGVRSAGLHGRIC